MSTVERLPAGGFGSASGHIDCLEDSDLSGEDAGSASGSDEGCDGSAASKGKDSLREKKVAVDVDTTRECSYRPVPWSKRQKRMSANTADMLLARRHGLNIRRDMSAALGCGYLPNRVCRPLGISSQRMFCGRFSTSGDVLLTASQDAIINLYDAQKVYQWSAKELEPGMACLRTQRGSYLRRDQHRANPKVWAGAPEPMKTIRCHDTGWSVISTDFSPDERWLVYSGWSPDVHLCNMRGQYELHEALHFEPTRGDHFCLFSIQFSPSNTHILGGGSDKCVYLYSLERKTRVARIKAHGDDVNAVAFSDHGSQVVLSGGDDCVIKVWDLRSPEKAVGGLCGHQAGVTCITAKGDGHHFISNGKDQTLKLWDIRRMLNPEDKRIHVAAVVPEWDYRLPEPGTRQFSRARRKKIADMSVRTFHGHKVLQTLIRCYFSPQHTTGQRYVMSGSSDGQVCIWDTLTGEMVRSLSWHQSITRDVSWHPNLPFIASFSWDASVGLWDYKADADEP